ncbi:MAG: hypothetical protein ABI857_11235 [Acidobacteriota bacterium]
MTALLDFRNFRKGILTAGFGLAILIGANVDATAQSRREIERERQRIEREDARYQRERQRRNRNDRNGPVVTRRTEQRVANANYSNGYQQGLLAGEYDRRKRKYDQSNVYRETGSYPNDGDPTSSDYIYRQGYLQGYNDGFNGIRNY